VLDKTVLTIDTKNFSNGIYLFAINLVGEIIEKQKVIISK
jgi:hypothetical protein